MPASAESALPRQAQPFGRYALLERLNMGGMAEVFLAKANGRHEAQRFVAIKRILPTVADDPEFVRMFIDEAKLSVQLTHPHVAQTFELGRIGRSLYIAMEYVSGVDLRIIWEHMQQGGDMPVAALVYIVAKLCEGLDYAHKKSDDDGRALGIVHRDISPQNVMVSYDGRVKVIDFGIAKAKVRASQTRVGILKGKFAYMSPEQVGGLELDARSDVFSVGIVLYEMLTRSRLFKSESDFMTLERVKHVELFPPSLVSPRISKALEAIVLRTLARDRDERTPSALALAEMLSKYAQESGETCTAADVGALLQREFAEDYQREQERLSELWLLEAPPSDERPRAIDEVSGSDSKPDPQRREAVAAAALASGETMIFGMAPVAEPTRLGVELSDTPDIRRPVTRELVEPTRIVAEPPVPMRRERSGSKPSQVAPVPPASARDVTRIVDELSVAPASPVDDDLATERVRIERRGQKKRAEPSRSGPSTRAPGSVSGQSSRSGLSGSAARLATPRFGRESVVVWMSTAVAIVLVVLAYWLSGQLNPSAKLLIDAEPATAELVVNAKRLGPIAGRAGFEVAPGDVIVEVRASGYCSWFRHLKLSAKETFSTRVTLVQKTTPTVCP